MKTISVLVILLFSQTMYAAHHYVAMVDMTTSSNKPTLGQRYVVIPEKSAAPLTAALEKLKNTTANSEEAKTARQAVKNAAKLSDVRTFMKPGSGGVSIEESDDYITLYVVYDTRQFVPELKMEEKPRSTQFAEDFRTLVTVALAIATKGVTAPTYRVITKTYQPGGDYRRSTMSFDVATKTIADAKTVKDCHDAALNANTDASVCDQFSSDNAKADVTVNFALLNGPVEHWFISADVPVTRSNDVTYDSTGHAIATSGTPSQPHAGFNYMIGDVRASHVNWYERFFGKALVLMSKHPKDSYGAGVGYRFPVEWKPLGFELDNLSVFGAYMHARTAANRTYHDHVRFGVSFNLDKALNWFKAGQTTKK